MSDPTHTPDDHEKADQPEVPAADGTPTADAPTSDAPAGGDADSVEATTESASESSAGSETPASTYTGPTAPASDAFAAPHPGHQPTAEQRTAEQPAAEQPSAEQPTAPQPTAQYPSAPLAGSHPAPSGPPISTTPGSAHAFVAGAPAPGGSTTGTATATATKDRKRPLAVPVVIALVAGALVGGGSAAGVSALMNHNGSTGATTSSGSPQTITINDTGDVNAVTAIAKKAGPSVVTINVSAGQEGGTGSGVILSSDGYVLTNTHVVTLDGASGDGSVEVTTYDGKLYKAKVVGTDPIVDLAVIKLQDASGLTPIEWGDSAKLNVGDRVVAIGAPLGLSNTVTDGIVSALNRSIQIQSSAAPKSDGGDQSSPNDNGGNGPFNFWNFGNGGGSGNGDGSSGNGGSVQSQASQISLPVIQTDAAINPGNSGGALVDDAGRIVGINVAIASTGSTDTSGQSGSIGVGFAVPADLAHRIADEIRKTGKGTHGLLGASVQDATADNSSTVGAMIASVTNGGAAASAGLQKGDVVTGIGEQGGPSVPVTSSTDLTAQVRYFAPGTKVTITYNRDGKSATANVTLGTLSS